MSSEDGHVVVLFGPGLDEPGGMAKRARILAEGLRDRGWEVRMISRMATSRRFRLRRQPGLVSIEVPGFSSRFLGAALYLLVAVMAGVFWARTSDWLLSLHLSSPSTSAALVSAVTGRPFLAFTTSSGALSEVRQLHVGRLGRLRRWLLSRAAAFVAQTRYAADEVRAVHPGVPVIVLPSPVELIDPPPLSGRPKAVFVGRLSAEKDLPLLLSAWREVATDHEDAELTIVGSGGAFRSVEEDVRTLAGRDRVLRASVRFTGWVGDVSPHLKSADIFVLPSRSEGMSNALLEACAAGRVVVAAAIPPNVELLGTDYPLLCETGDSLALERVLRRALQDEAVRQVARRRVLSVAASASKDAVIDRLEAVLTGETPHRSRDQHPEWDRRR